MQSLENCEFVIEILEIEHIVSDSQYFEIFFSTVDGERYKFIFNRVWDMRYSIENASIDRFCKFRKCLPEGIIDTCVYVVKNSDYIKYFEQQVSGTLPTDELTHYIVSDRTDTTLDILANYYKPVLVQISESSS